MQSRSQLTSLPNLLTIGRILVIPVIIYLLTTGDIALRAMALAIYVAAAATDWLDGYLARKSGESSPLGRMLDPIADKLLVGALLIAFAWDGSFSLLDLVPAIAIMVREIFVSGLREFLGSAKIDVPVTRLAKWKTTIQLIALAIVFLEGVVPGFRLASDVTLWLAAILTVWTGLQYLIGAWPYLEGRKP